MDPPAELASSSDPIPMETEPSQTAMTEEGGATNEPAMDAPGSTPEKASASAMEEDNPASSPATTDANTGSGDDDTSSATSVESDAGLSPTEDATDHLLKATTCKEQGNDFFKTGDLEKASRSYRKGINLLKPLNKNNTGDEQVKALLISLQNNLSMVLFKQSKFRQSRDVATKVLKVDDKNVKALYRRALSHRTLGDLAQARSDLKEALKRDGSNTAVKKELVSIKKEIETAKASQKKALQKAFASDSGGLYDDKEEEKRKKEEEKQRKEEEEAKALEKRKAQWEDECVARMAKNEPAISFKDWEKEQEEIVKKQKEEEEKVRAEEKKARAKARKAAAASKKANDSDSDDDKLTESELAMFRGYKKTADGRTTSYFHKELSESEKQMIGDITPQRLDATTPTNGSQPQQLPCTASAEQKGRPSVWNQAGTWEEKDTTSWCNERLRARLLETKFQKNSSGEQYLAIVSKVKDMTGDASVAITGGKKRYIFDFHVKVKFQIKDADVDEVIGEGSLHLPDICSTHHEELEVNFTGWEKSKSPAKEREAATIECKQGLIAQVRCSVQKWVEDFNEMY